MRKALCAGWLHAAAVVMAAVFVLPSCFTFGIWRGGRPSQAREDVPITAADDEGAAATPTLRLVVRVAGEVAWRTRDGGRADPWTPPFANGEWLAIEPDEHAAEAVRLWREVPEACALEVLPDPHHAGPPRCWFVCSPQRAHTNKVPDGFADLPGVHRGTGYFGAAIDVFEAECRLTPCEPPRADRSRTIAVHSCGPASGTLSRLVQTPLTLVLDAALSPFELMTIAVWW
ncbi:MAG: hypothetical protein AB7O97_14510 [Planctomycetota bacterium]